MFRRLALGGLALFVACARPGPTEPGAGGAHAPARAATEQPAPPGATAPSEPAPPPSTNAPAAAAAAELEAPRSEKTAGITDVQRAGPPRLLQAVRAATAADHDRVVFEFLDGVPGFHLEYVDRPIRDCGAGDEKPIDGDGWLEVRFYPASAHTEAGQPTVAERELRPRLPIVREIERTCDFEAVVTWVVGTASPNRYRAFELREPPRLVIDIDH